MVATAPRTHVFAHLGPAPYRYLGYERKVFQSIPGCPDCPMQPGATCDHCGTGIMDTFRFRAADGREFIVGSDCVHKSGDANLRKVISADVSTHRREVVKARAANLLDRALAALPALRDTFAAEPHPNAWAAAKGRTRLDWIDWMLANAGRTGRTEVAKYILAAVPE